MRFFTRLLYESLNSPDAETADFADDQWDRAESEYETRLKRIRPKLTEAAKTLAHRMCLHDAQLFQQWQDNDFLVLWIGSDAEGYILRYRLVKPTKSSKPRKTSPFSPFAVRWLYDEIDLVREGTFSHDILFSDGHELHVEFDECQIVETRSLNSVSRKSARSPLPRKKKTRRATAYPRT